MAAIGVQESYAKWTNYRDIESPRRSSEYRNPTQKDPTIGETRHKEREIKNRMYHEVEGKVRNKIKVCVKTTILTNLRKRKEMAINSDEGSRVICTPPPLLPTEKRKFKATSSRELSRNSNGRRHAWCRHRPSFM